MHLNQSRLRQPRRRLAPADVILPADRIGQNVFRNALGKSIIEARPGPTCPEPGRGSRGTGLYQKDLGRLDRFNAGNAQLLYAIEHTLAVHIGKARPIKNLKPPLLHGISSFLFILYFISLLRLSFALFRRLSTCSLSRPSTAFLSFESSDMILSMPAA